MSVGVAGSETLSGESAAGMRLQVTLERGSAGFVGERYGRQSERVRLKKLM